MPHSYFPFGAGRGSAPFGKTPNKPGATDCGRAPRHVKLYLTITIARRTTDQENGEVANVLLDLAFHKNSLQIMPMKIAAAQIACTPGDLEANLRRSNDFASHAKDSGVELIVF